MAGAALDADDLERIRRRLVDVLSGDDAVRLLGHVDYLRGELVAMYRKHGCIHGHCGPCVDLREWMREGTQHPG